MKLYTVLVTLTTVAVIPPGPSEEGESFSPPPDGFGLSDLNALLWERGWSVTGPWRVAGDNGRMRLASVALKRG